MRTYHSAQMLNFDNRRVQPIGGSLFWHIWGRNHCNIFRAQQELHLRTDRMILGLAVQRKLIAEENNPNLKLRMFVSGGGCSGMQYGFTFEETANEDDFDLEFDGIHLLIDAMSSQYLQGAEVDYTESLQGSQFSIKNPQAQTTCGCGSSFNPG